MARGDSEKGSAVNDRQTLSRFNTYLNATSLTLNQEKAEGGKKKGVHPLGEEDGGYDSPRTRPSRESMQNHSRRSRDLKGLPPFPSERGEKTGQGRRRR